MAATITAAATAHAIPAARNRLSTPPDPAPDTPAEPTIAGAGDVPKYHYRRDDDDEWTRTLPLNLAVLDSIENVAATIAATNWTRKIAEYNRHAPDPSTGEYVEQEASLATSPQGLVGRDHVRLWEFDGVTFGQAHEDTPAVPRHRIRSHETARRRVAALLLDDGYRVAGRLDAANGAHRDHDGSILVLDVDP